MRQVHKDYHAAIEEGRRRVFAVSRPVNDFFHLMEKRKTIEMKLQKSVLQRRKFVKVQMEWTMLSLHVLRRVPTIDLYSELWRGVLTKLECEGESVAVEYLGPGGHAVYTEELTVADLRSKYNVRAVNPQGGAKLLFSSHWSGLTGILRGTDCGDQAQEAFHSPWQAQLDVVGKNVSPEKVFDVMQALYKLWQTQCKWVEEKPLYAHPPSADPAWLNGSVLGRVGRSNAMELWDASRGREIHLVVEVDDHMEVVAMVYNAGKDWDAEAATTGCQMLLASGEKLRNILIETGLLQPVAEGVARLRTKLSAVRRVLQDIAYVFVLEPGHGYMGVGTSPACTCASFCHHGGCEHCEFVAMLNLRLRTQSSFPESLPSQRKRGRPLGAHTRGSKRLPRGASDRAPELASRTAK